MVHEVFANRPRPFGKWCRTYCKRIESPKEMVADHFYLVSDHLKYAHGPIRKWSSTISKVVANHLPNHRGPIRKRSWTDSQVVAGCSEMVRHRTASRGRPNSCPISISTGVRAAASLRIPVTVSGVVMVKHMPEVSSAPSRTARRRSRDPDRNGADGTACLPDMHRAGTDTIVQDEGACIRRAHTVPRWSTSGR
jgi:hypothetical protein